MTKLIALDDGHGAGTAGKRTPFIPEIGRYIPENEFNKAVVKYLDVELKRQGFKTVLTAPTDVDTPLSTRVNTANNARADLFISIHYNAFDGTFEGRNPEGFSAHIDPSGGESEKFAKIALKHLAKGTVQQNRGVVKQQLYVTAYTKMPAVLFELGFMDNNREALLMIDKSFQQECAKEIAMAVCEYYGVTYKPEKETPQVVKPSGKQTKIGEAVMLRDVQAYARPEFGTQIPTVIKKGEKRNVYEIENGWYRLYGGEYIPSNYGKNFKYTPVKKGEPSTEEIRRVIVDGKQVGAYSDHDNVLRVVADELKKDPKEIRVEEK
ncbi:N-acetylmuramoyl-L-alanine amidase [Bacteroides graminisolvens]|uniref:N-acetylmuramoyl-L-alanine amidase n=1 Tax=Bacteroides graminisolvens TaxID=477666 RepID=UPI00240A6477|nr:N-acetylmuramoyl-L-alanine amidase [Bacteroides graminisolvens]